MARAKAVSTYRQMNDFFVSMLLNDPQNGSSLILCLLISIWQQSFEVTPPPPQRGGGGIVCHSKEKLQSASVFGVTIKIISADVLFCSHMNSPLRCHTALPHLPLLEWKKWRQKSCVTSNKAAAKSLCLSDLLRADLQMSCSTATKYFGSFAEPLVKSIRTNYCSKLP